MFHCQHRSSDYINWRVNGTSFNSLNISIEKSPLSGGGFGSYLYISTLPEYNRTTIDCVAIFFQGPSPFQFTLPVTLLIQGEILIIISISTIIIL